MVLPALRSDDQGSETWRCALQTTVRAALSVLPGDSGPKTWPQEAETWRGHTPGRSFGLEAHRGGHLW